jgi:hypothetical protein
VASVVDFLGPLGPWYNEHCRPINVQAYTGDEAGARAALARAWSVLQADAALDADQQRALEYMLLAYDYTLVDHFSDSDAARGEQFGTTCAAFAARPPAGPLSDVAQAVNQVIMLGSGTRRGFIRMTEPEVDALWARIPSHAQTPNLWYYIVAWAYHHNNLRYLELAMERQTVETTGWQDDYFWLRTNFMYLLVEGRATRLDVEKTLRGYVHPHNFVDFRNMFLGRCEQAGLMDAELYLLLDQREAELRALAGTVPERTPKTVRVVKQG